jgi:hypothetical protein
MPMGIRETFLYLLLHFFEMGLGCSAKQFVRGLANELPDGVSKHGSQSIIDKHQFFFLNNANPVGDMFDKQTILLSVIQDEMKIQPQRQ